MFSCKKVRHIAYYERSVYLAWFVEFAGYEFRSIVDRLSGPTSNTYLQAFPFVLMSHCYDMFRQV